MLERAQRVQGVGLTPDREAGLLAAWRTRGRSSSSRYGSASEPAMNSGQIAVSPIRGPTIRRRGLAWLQSGLIAMNRGRSLAAAVEAGRREDAEEDEDAGAPEQAE